MDKVLNFLEKHVQWIAVGIGGLIFLYAIWLYWLDPSSLTADVGSRKVGPSQVDQEVLAGPGQALQNAIRNPRTPPTMGPNTNLDEQVRSRIAPGDR